MPYAIWSIKVIRHNFISIEFLDLDSLQGNGIVRSSIQGNTTGQLQKRALNRLTVLTNVCRVITGLIWTTKHITQSTILMQVCLPKCSNLCLGGGGSLGQGMFVFVLFFRLRNLNLFFVLVQWVIFCLSTTHFVLSPVARSKGRYTCTYIANSNQTLTHLKLPDPLNDLFVCLL